MRLIAIHVTSDFRGDHAADIEVPYELRPGETVEALVRRLGLHTSNPAHGDHIVLRRVVDA